jgi:CheY-like chemotaxis protein
MKILLVDDCAEYRAMICDLLESDGHILLPALSGEEALHILTRESADIIITDLAMPGITGAEFLELIDFRGIPAIVASGRDVSQEMAVFSKSTRIAAFLQKPFPIRSLRSIIDRMEQTCSVAAGPEMLVRK